MISDANLAGSAFGEAGLKVFERELKEAIIPFVEKSYRVKAGAGNRALAGLSMSGIHTLYTGSKNTDLFSYLGVFSSGWSVPAQTGGPGDFDYFHITNTIADKK